MEMRLLNVCGFDEATRAMRLSFNSISKEDELVEDIAISEEEDCPTDFAVWRDDYLLLKGLIKKGDSHAKVVRMIQVWMKIKAPRYWWAEWDTYRIGTTEMSESTMHTITSRDLVSDDFEGTMDAYILNRLNSIRNNGNMSKNCRMYMIKHNLPESFLQTRIVNTNYQVLRHVYFDRKNHRLPEWHIFIQWMDDHLPFYSFITVE